MGSPWNVLDRGVVGSVGVGHEHEGRVVGAARGRRQRRQRQRLRVPRELGHLATAALGLPGGTSD